MHLDYLFVVNLSRSCTISILFLLGRYADALWILTWLDLWETSLVVHRTTYRIVPWACNCYWKKVYLVATRKFSIVSNFIAPLPVVKFFMPLRKVDVSSSNCLILMFQRSDKKVFAGVEHCDYDAWQMFQGNTSRLLELGKGNYYMYLEYLQRDLLHRDLSFFNIQ